VLRWALLGVAAGHGHHNGATTASRLLSAVEAMVSTASDNSWLMKAVLVHGRFSKVLFGTSRRRYLAVWSRRLNEAARGIAQIQWGEIWATEPYLEMSSPMSTPIGEPMVVIDAVMKDIRLFQVPPPVHTAVGIESMLAMERLSNSELQESLQMTQQFCQEIQLASFAMPIVSLRDAKSDRCLPKKQAPPKSGPCRASRASIYDQWSAKHAFWCNSGKHRKGYIAAIAVKDKFAPKCPLCNEQLAKISKAMAMPAAVICTALSQASPLPSTPEEILSAIAAQASRGLICQTHGSSFDAVACIHAEI